MYTHTQAHMGMGRMCSRCDVQTHEPTLYLMDCDRDTRTENERMNLLETDFKKYQLNCICMVWMIMVGVVVSCILIRVYVFEHLNLNLSVF